MSTAEGAGQREEGEYGRAAKRQKTEERETETEAEEREEGEEELEEGEDSDSGSLPGNAESAGDNRARRSASQFGEAGKVRRATHGIKHIAASQTSACASARARGRCHCVSDESIQLQHHR
ncbi:hypothetical protein EYF80_038937 [Liparis tanakae]|uniref:Uncharacterized protein n=1 Tax=Liparis tanakae TaxID=230148 RepID=A0A4Z2GDQ4_9TELE|nr:hypothetical protein EYF80_038937 [Liparis tanakae]